MYYIKSFQPVSFVVFPIGKINSTHTCMAQTLISDSVKCQISINRVNKQTTGSHFRLLFCPQLLGDREGKDLQGLSKHCLPFGLFTVCLCTVHCVYKWFSQAHIRPSNEKNSCFHKWIQTLYLSFIHSGMNVVLFSVSHWAAPLGKLCVMCLAQGHLSSNEGGTALLPLCQDLVCQSRV